MRRETAYRTADEAALTAWREWQDGQQATARVRKTFDLPGMATFYVYSTDRGLIMGGPSLWEWDGVLYAYWECDDAPHEDMWEQIPMSTYYLAKEAYDANQG